MVKSGDVTTVGEHTCRRRRLPASPHGLLLLAATSSSVSGILPKTKPPASVPARPRWFRRLTLARAAVGRDPETEPSAPPEEAERRSLAVTTGELLLGLAALLLPAGRGGAAAVDEVEARDGVVWEQRPEDVEAERRRRELTSPGFSFSTAGLLFPYHLGDAQCLNAQ
uniref:Uncharacterized protein n=1 Tax=Oryza brachyantha TaxID=4533 RepID=J3LLJ0_ORYBR